MKKQDLRKTGPGDSEEVKQMIGMVNVKPQSGVVFTGNPGEQSGTRME